MGKVIFVDFSTISLDDEFYIEIVDSESGDSYFYFEHDMIPEPTETESFHALSQMIDELGERYMTIQDTFIKGF
jgi:hypothetical protein